MNAAQASSGYLEKEIIPSMRAMMQKAQAPPKGKKGAPAQPPAKVPGIKHALSQHVQLCASVILPIFWAHQVCECARLPTAVHAAADARTVRLVQVQSAHVYVASEFGGWQARVLRWLAQHFDPASKSFDKEASSGVIQQVLCWHGVYDCVELGAGFWRE